MDRVTEEPQEVLDPKKVLIFYVEDEEAQRDLIVRLNPTLENIKPFASAQECLLEIEKATKTGSMPDLILTDKDMPQMNGIDFLRKAIAIIGSSQRPVKRPVLMMITGRPWEITAKERDELGIHTVLEKPRGIFGLAEKIIPVIKAHWANIPPPSPTS